MIDDEIEIQAIKDTRHWPFWPLLPIKNCNSSEGLEVGILLATNIEMPGEKIKVYNANLFDSQELKTMRSRPALAEFATVEELVEAGWVGD